VPGVNVVAVRVDTSAEFLGAADVVDYNYVDRWAGVRRRWSLRPAEARCYYAM
jgi:hypothetical protein